MKSLFRLFDLNPLYYKEGRPFLYTFYISKSYWHILPETHIKFSVPLKEDKLYLFSHFGNYGIIDDIKNHIISTCFEDSIFVYDKYEGYSYKLWGKYEVSSSNSIVYIKNRNIYVPYYPLIRNHGNRDLYLKDAQGIYHKFVNYKSSSLTLGGSRHSFEGLFFIKYTYKTSTFRIIPCTSVSSSLLGFVRPR